MFINSELSNNNSGQTGSGNNQNRNNPQYPASVTSVRDRTLPTQGLSVPPPHLNQSGGLQSIHRYRHIQAPIQTIPLPSYPSQNPHQQSQQHSQQQYPQQQQSQQQHYQQQYPNPPNPHQHLQYQNSVTLQSHVPYQHIPAILPSQLHKYPVRQQKQPQQQHSQPQYPQQQYPNPQNPHQHQHLQYQNSVTLHSHVPYQHIPATLPSQLHQYPVQQRTISTLQTRAQDIPHQLPPQEVTQRTVQPEPKISPIEFVPNKKTLQIKGPNFVRRLTQDEECLANIKKILRFVEIYKLWPGKALSLSLTLNDQFLFAGAENKTEKTFYIPFIIAILAGPDAYLLFIKNNPETAYKDYPHLKKSKWALNYILENFYDLTNLDATLNALEQLYNPLSLKSKFPSRYISVYFDCKVMYYTPIDNGKYSVGDYKGKINLDFNTYSWFQKNDNERTTTELVTMFRNQEYDFLSLILTLPGVYPLFLQATHEYFISLSPELQLQFPKTLIRRISEKHQKMTDGYIAFYDEDFYENYYKLCSELSIESPQKIRTEWAYITVDGKSYEGCHVPYQTMQCLKKIFDPSGLEEQISHLKKLNENFLITFDKFENLYVPVVLFEENSELYLLYLKTIMGDSPSIALLKQHFDYLKNALTSYYKEPHQLFSQAEKLEKEFTESISYSLQTSAINMPELPSHETILEANSIDLEPTELVMPQANLKEIATFVQTLDNTEKRAFRTAYLMFYDALNKELNNPHLAKGLRAFLLKENGFFAFNDYETSALSMSFERIWKRFEESSSDVPEVYKKQIANDFLTFFVFTTKSNEFVDEHIIAHNIALTRQICHGKTLLTNEDTRKVLETFFRVKIKEYRHHIQSILRPKEETESSVIPCYFIYYNDKTEPTLKIHNAFFDKCGILRCLFAGDQNGENYIQSLLNFDSRADERAISYQDLEMLKLAVENQNDVSFIILEEKELQVNGNTLPKKLASSKEPPRKRRRVTQSTKKNVVVANDVNLLVEPNPLLENTKAKSSSYSLAISNNNGIEVSGSFWQKISISQCKSAQSKSKPERSAATAIKTIQWNLPNLSTVGKTERALYMMEAKEYQQKGINALLDFNELGISGLLRWWMGLGKSLVAQELCMRIIAENDSGSMLILTPNHVRAQLIQETKERIAKAKFAVILSSAFHFQKLSQDEKKERFEIIRQMIDKGFSSEQKLDPFQIKSALILLAALPDQEKTQVLSTIDYKNIQKIPALFTSYFEEILDKDNGEIFEIIEKATNEKVNSMKDAIDIINDNKSNFVFQINFLGELLMIDPSYPYKKAKDNFLGANIAEFRRIQAFSCETQISKIDFKTAPAPSQRVNIYFGSYHEFSNTTESTLTAFAANTGTLQVFADEAHTLAENKKVGKNKNIRFLFEKLREANPRCRIIPSSGTFVRGKLNELLYLFELFNPNLISIDARISLCQSFQQGTSALQTILNKGDLTNCEKEIGEILNSYVQLLILGQIINAISLKAHPKDHNVQENWKGRMPLKHTIQKDYSLEELDICQEVQDEAAKLDRDFKNRENMLIIQNNLDRLLIYYGLNEGNVLKVHENIRSAAGNPQKMAEELSKSYRASAIIKTLEENQAIEKQQKVIVFTHRILTSEVLQTYLKSFYTGKDLKVHLYNGKTKKADRPAIINSFRKGTGAHVLLISLQTGSVGLNLPEADAIYLAETIWEPMERKQAKYRANRANTVGNKTVYALDKQEKQFAVERNRQNILKMKTKLSRFCSNEFTSHQEHISLYLDALQWHAHDQSYKVMRNFSQELIDTLIPQLQELLQIEVSKPQFLETFARINPLLFNNNETFRDKGKERMRVSPESTEKQVTDNTNNVEFQPVSLKSLSVEPQTPINNAASYPIDRAFSIPIHHGSMERAAICADALLNSNKPDWVMNAIRSLNNVLASNPSLKSTIRNLGFKGISNTQIPNYSQIQQFYVWLDTILLEKEEEESEESRQKHIYSYKAASQTYVRTSINGDERPDVEAIKLREVGSSSNITYDVLIPK